MSGVRRKRRLEHLYRRALRHPAFPVVCYQSVDLVDLVLREVELLRLDPPICVVKLFRVKRLDGRGYRTSFNIVSISLRLTRFRRTGRRLIIPSSDTTRMTVGMPRFSAKAKYLNAELYRAPRARSPSPIARPSRITAAAWHCAVGSTSRAPSMRVNCRIRSSTTAVS